jgi:hypothetical protein
VGDLGTVGRLVRGTWSTESFPDRLARLRGVAALGGDEAWALEEAGWLWRRDSAGWTRLDSPRVDGARALAFDASGHGMAVGRTAVAYDGGVWRAMAAPWSRASDVAWAGATAVVAADGGVTAWDGARWRPLALPGAAVPPSAVDRVAAAGATWMAADRGGALVLADPQPRVVWPVVGALDALDVRAPGAGWAGGASLGAGLVGSKPRDGAWSLTLPMPAGGYISGLGLLESGEGWAVGTVFDGATPRNEMWRYGGGEWQPAYVGADWGLVGVESVAPDDAWAAGPRGAARWNGDAWKIVEGAPAGPLTGQLAMVSGGQEPEGWFAARGGVYHLAGGEWTRHSLEDWMGAGAEVVGLARDPERGAWVAASSHVLRLAPGGVVAALPDPPATGLRHISVTPDGAVWVLADPEGLLRWDAARGLWERHGLPSGASRVVPRRIQALDQRFDPGRPAPEGWAGFDVWVAGYAAVGRFRAVRPTFSAYLPVARR